MRRGAVVTRREVTVGGGHVSGQLGWWHFGLGADTQAEIRVVWPSGSADDWQPVKGDGFYTLAPGKPPEAWTPPATAAGGGQ